MNILVVAFHQVYPLQTGASIAQFAIIEYLSHKCNISLLLPDNSTIKDRDFDKLKELLPKVKVYIADESCKLGEETIKKKTYNLLRIVKKKVTAFLKFLLKGNGNAHISAEEEEFIEILWNPYSTHNIDFVEKIYEIILKDKIDIVQLEHIENLNLVTLIPPYVKKVFVEHECIFNRIESHIKAKQIKSVFADYIMNFYKSTEISLLEQANAVITFNQAEDEILKKAIGDKNNKIDFLISPFPILDRDFKELSKENFHRPNKLVFVGGGHHYPNFDAVEWFLEETAEEVFKKYGLRLYVVGGRWRPNIIKKYKNHPSGVCFVGFIEDLYEFSKDSISIAPVRIGGGLKTKIMLSMAQGIPVICTTSALEGINAKHTESVMIADDKDSFCGAIEYLLADLERTFTICQTAQSLMKQGYSQSVVSDFRYSFYQKLLHSQ